MKRHYRHFLEDIVEYSKVSQDLIKSISFEEFENDLTVFLATTRALEIIGEAIKHIPEEIKLKHPDIPWQKITGFRNMVIHEYFGIDKEIVWNAAKINAVFLKEQISRILEDIGEDE